MSIFARRSSGSGISSSPACTQASEVSTPQPPATVKISVRGPRGSGWVANAAAASYASSIVSARVMPAWRQTPAKIRSSEASAPV